MPQSQFGVWSTAFWKQQDARELVGHDDVGSRRRRDNSAAPGRSMQGYQYCWELVTTKCHAVWLYPNLQYTVMTYHTGDISGYRNDTVTKAEAEDQNLICLKKLRLLHVRVCQIASLDLEAGVCSSPSASDTRTGDVVPLASTWIGTVVTGGSFTVSWFWPGERWDGVLPFCGRLRLSIFTVTPTAATWGLPIQKMAHKQNDIEPFREAVTKVATTSTKAAGLMGLSG